MASINTGNVEWSLGFPKSFFLLGNLLLFHAFDQATFTCQSTLANVFVFAAIAALVEFAWDKQRSRDEGCLEQTEVDHLGPSVRPLASQVVSPGGCEEAPLLKQEGQEEELELRYDALDETPTISFVDKKSEEGLSKEVEIDTRSNLEVGDNCVGSHKERQADIFLHHLIDQNGKKTYFRAAPGYFFPCKEHDSDDDCSEEESEGPPPLCYHTPFHGRIAYVAAEGANMDTKGALQSVKRLNMPQGLPIPKTCDDSSDDDSSEEESEGPPPLCYHAPFHGKIAHVAKEDANTDTTRDHQNLNRLNVLQSLPIPQKYDNSSDGDSSEEESEGPPPLSYHVAANDAEKAATTKTLRDVPRFGSQTPAFCFYTPIDVEVAGATAEDGDANTPRYVTDPTTRDVSHGLTDSRARALSFSEIPEIQRADNHSPMMEDRYVNEKDFLERAEAINSLFDFPRREDIVKNANKYFPAEQQVDSSSSSSEGHWQVEESYMIEPAIGEPWVDLWSEEETQQNDERHLAAGGYSRGEVALVGVDGFAALQDASEKAEAQSTEDAEWTVGERSAPVHPAKTINHRRIHTLKTRKQSHDMKEPAATESSLPDSTEGHQPTNKEEKDSNMKDCFEMLEETLFESPQRELHKEKPKRTAYEVFTGERQGLRRAWGRSSSSYSEGDAEENKFKSPYGSIGVSGGFALMASCATLQDADTSKEVQEKSAEDGESTFWARSVREAYRLIESEASAEVPPEVRYGIATSDVLDNIAQNAPREVQTIGGLLSTLPSPTSAAPAPACLSVSPGSPSATPTAASSTTGAPTTAVPTVTPGSPSATPTTAGPMTGSQADSERLTGMSPSLPRELFQPSAVARPEGGPAGSKHPTMEEGQLKVVRAIANMPGENQQLNGQWSTKTSTNNATNSNALQQQQQPKRNTNNRPKKYKVKDKTPVLKSILYQVESKTLKASKTIWRALQSAKRRAKRQKKGSEGATRRGRYKCNLCQQQLGDSHDCPFVSVPIHELWELRPHLPTIPDYLNSVLDQHDQSMQKQRPAALRD